jgi:hypothetical protein
MMGTDMGRAGRLEKDELHLTLSKPRGVCVVGMEDAAYRK